MPSLLGDVAPVRPSQQIPTPGQLPPRATATPRKGHRTTAQSKRQRARDLRAMAYSYSEIAKMLGVSKPQAWWLVNSPQGHTVPDGPAKAYFSARAALVSRARHRRPRHEPPSAGARLGVET